MVYVGAITKIFDVFCEIEPSVTYNTQNSHARHQVFWEKFVLLDIGIFNDCADPVNPDVPFLDTSSP